MEEQLKQLLEQGFVPYRKIWDKVSRTFNYVKTPINIFYLKANFNVMQPGGIGIFLIKDNERYYFGLNVLNTIVLKEDK